MKVTCKRPGIYIPKDGKSVELKVGNSTIDDAIAKRLIARGLVTEFVPDEDEEVADKPKRQTKKQAAKVEPEPGTPAPDADKDGETGNTGGEE